MKRVAPQPASASDGRLPEVRPTGGPLGAWVTNVDLGKPLSPPVVAALKEALLEHLVLFFRDQRLTEEQQVDFTRHFGEPDVHVRDQPERPVEEIFIVSNVTEHGMRIGALGNGELTFHSDLSYLPRPGTISIVQAIEVPPAGGDTQWANCYAAYDALPGELLSRVKGRRALHRHDEKAQNPPEPVWQPIVRTHPETGRRATYVSPQFTRAIEGLEDAGSRELLDTLLAHVTNPRFVWTHRWRPGDVVVWDNRCTMHRRESFDDRHRRILKRTQVFGEPACKLDRTSARTR